MYKSGSCILELVFANSNSSVMSKQASLTVKPHVCHVSLVKNQTVLCPPATHDTVPQCKHVLKICSLSKNLLVQIFVP